MSGEIAITPDLAARLSKLCGNGADLWLILQARYDVWEATQRLAEQLKATPTLAGSVGKLRKSGERVGRDSRPNISAPRRRASSAHVSAAAARRASNRLNDWPRRLLGRLSRRWMSEEPRAIISLLDPGSGRANSLLSDKDSLLRSLGNFLKKRSDLKSFSITKAPGSRRKF